MVEYEEETFKCPKCGCENFMLFAAKRTGKIMKLVCASCFHENVLMGERRVQPINKGGSQDGADDAGH